jgi:hypothetical protein
VTLNEVMVPLEDGYLKDGRLKDKVEQERDGSCKSLRGNHKKQ